MSFLLGYTVGSTQAKNNAKKEIKKERIRKAVINSSLRMRLFKAEEKLGVEHGKTEIAEYVASTAITSLINTCKDCCIIMTATSSPDIDKRHIFLWKTKQFFTEMYPGNGQPYFLKWFENLWYNPDKTGGFRNGFYYIDTDDSPVEFVEKTIKSKKGEPDRKAIFPTFDEHKKTENHILGTPDLFLENAWLNFNKKFPNNLFIKIFGRNFGHFTEIFALRGINKFGNAYEFKFGEGKEEKMLKFSEMFFGEIPAANVHIVDADMY